MVGVQTQAVKLGRGQQEAGCMAVTGLLQTEPPRGPLGLSHFWFCSPVPSPRDRRQSLPALEEPPARGGRDVCSLSETLTGPDGPPGRTVGAWP